MKFEEANTKLPSTGSYFSAFQAKPHRKCSKVSQLACICFGSHTVFCVFESRLFLYSPLQRALSCLTFACLQHFCPSVNLQSIFFSYLFSKANNILPARSSDWRIDFKRVFLPKVSHLKMPVLPILCQCHNNFRPSTDANGFTHEALPNNQICLAINLSINFAFLL